ncbi:MAG TPA: hypothetical protein DF296_11640 [Candidatus Margulisbacteria bacterium]|nr:MAG: hypothetical protein A2X43_12380 [Candidatus Margulisbacteria bacterium GWD2_39_127]OGI03251.1 MAG: hypothetical protein A2X42_11620 [Candidatus Margulisbacteria bacterium GWF2_38_17]OGI11274.1 MAG: hypothetical protein A2X41_04045 [Candidatus Margulisbacteria bacterium GWE2_39_32]HAR63930.1 hypothetical protein [Candidatus Margulisiibacteriota bacterium]HCT85833.1 hypothetical protein [Candidatus Margulisiibacteriota bacterium]
MKKFLVNAVEKLTIFVDFICQTKTEEEKNYLREAAAIADSIFIQVSKEIKPGVSELQIKRLFDSYVEESKAEKLAFDTIVASGPNGAFPHAVPSGRIIQRNDIVVIDFGVVYNGYHSDMTRTLLMDPDDKKARSLYKLVLEAQQLALAKVISGVDIKSLDDIARGHIGSYNFQDYFVHGLGHGVGLKIHEKPFINQRARGVLKKDMVITIEPGIYLPGYGGVRIEDTVIVGKKGYEVLTKSPKMIFS